MGQFVGLDVSVNETSVCVVDDAGAVLREQGAFDAALSRRCHWEICAGSGSRGSRCRRCRQLLEGRTPLDILGTFYRSDLSLEASKKHVRRQGIRRAALDSRRRSCQFRKFLKLLFFESIWNFVSVLSEQVSGTSLAERIFSEGQLRALLGGSDARRYALVNRALKDGSLIRLKRATYMLDQRGRSEAVHPFAVAQALLPGSYVSFETALAYHGWIPEAVFTTASVSPGRKTIIYDTQSLGQFSFHPLALREYQFLASVDREKFGKLAAFVAQPLRALIDLFALRKERWSGMDWLITGMRIDEDRLLSLKRKDFSALRPVYKHKAAYDFLHSLEGAILTNKGASKGRLADD